MSTIKGSWYPVGSSKKVTAQLLCNDDGKIIVSTQSDNVVVARSTVDEIDVSSRIGNTARFVAISNDGKFETTDNDGVDKLQLTNKNSKFGFSLYQLESRWRYALGALLLFSVISWAFVVYGIPAIANVTSRVLPQQVFDIASEQTMSALDKVYFDDSQLSQQRQQQVLDHFKPLINLYPALGLDVQFRNGGALGANAFALPNGLIVFTDEMVQLAQDDDELLAIMAHEIGHVVHRHGMRSMIQSSLFAFLLIAISGDAGAAAESLLGVPVLLTELAYSRNFERQADDHAFDYLSNNDLQTAHFANIMSRLELLHLCQEKSADVEFDETKTLQEVILECMEIEDRTISIPDNDSSGSIGNYLSTHPSTQERIERFR